MTESVKSEIEANLKKIREHIANSKTGIFTKKDIKEIGEMVRQLMIDRRNER